MTSTLRAAVVQAGSVVFDRGHALAKLADRTADAARRGARLVVFPEAFVGGYPKGADFGTRVGLRRAEGRELFRRYHDAALDVPGPDCERIGAAARSAGVHLVVGVIERAGGTLYCTALFFAPTGQLLGRHRKLMPTAMERLVWGFGDGSTLTAVDTPLGRIGAVICWENYMPLLRMAMYAKGVELYCAPTVDDRDTWPPTMQTIALEGRCFVLSACQYLTRADVPAGLVQEDGLGEVLIRGGSLVVSPLGQVLAGPVYGEETILTADLDRAEIARGKYDFDVTGHYARPDVFRLRVNEAPMTPVVTAGEADEPAPERTGQAP